MVTYLYQIYTLSLARWLRSPTLPRFLLSKYSLELPGLLMTVLCVCLGCARGFTNKVVWQQWGKKKGLAWMVLVSHPVGSPSAPEKGSHSLLQGILPIQGSNPGFPHCRWILYQLSHKGRILQWVAYPFSRGSSRTQELNWGFLHCCCCCC